MKSRTDEIWAKLSPIIEEQAIQDIEQAVSVSLACSGVLPGELQTALLACDRRALELQCRGEKGETTYITLSFLDSSILTGAYDLRIDFYDERFLVDIAEACAYFSYKHLIPIYLKSADLLCGEAKKLFSGIMDYEKDSLAWRYKDEVLLKMVESAWSLSLLHPDMKDFWPKLTVAENCVFTFGKFLHDQRLFHEFPPEKGLAD